MTRIDYMKPWKLKIHLIAEGIFQYSLITYLLLLLAETIQEGFVSFFFNLNLLLIVVLISGIMMVLTHEEKLEPHSPPQKMTSADLQNTLFFAIMGGLLVYYKTQLLGKLSILLAILTGTIIILLSVLLFTNPEE